MTKRIRLCKRSKRKRKDQYNFDEFDIKTLEREFGFNLDYKEETPQGFVITISEDKQDMVNSGKLQKLIDITRGISNNKESYDFPITGSISLNEITGECSVKQIKYDGNSNSKRCGLNIYDIDESPDDVFDKIKELNVQTTKYTNHVGFVKVPDSKSYNDIVNDIETNLKYDLKPVHIFVIYNDSITLLSFYKNSDGAPRTEDGSLILPNGELIPQNDSNPPVRDVYVRDIIDEHSGFFRSTHIPSVEYTIESFMEKHWSGV